MEDVTTALTAIAAFLAWFLPGARRALSYIQKARAAKEDLIEQKRAENIRQLESQHAEIAKKVDDAQREVNQAAKAAVDINKQLEQLRADRRLADYIRQRNESTDYTHHLGLIARVRSDFKQLSTLLRDVQAEADSELKRRQNETDQGQKLFPRIDRIILYIDDLDRCPEKNVVEVLQAVNLLLAFPLFVVVVGVDPRWLLHSLKQHSSAFSPSVDATGDSEFDPLWQSTPINYLEKIFQIPYTLRPMDSVGFARLVDSLSRGPRQEAPPVGSGVQYATPTSIGSRSSAPDAAEPVPAPETIKEPMDQTLAVNRSPEHLRIEVWEQSFMKLLHELIPTPRAGKRFVNIYRLIRATVGDGERNAFIGTSSGGEHQCALLLLAILTGYPAEATEMLEELIETVHEETWWTFVAALKSRTISPTPAAREPNRKEKRGRPNNSGAEHLVADESDTARWPELFTKLNRIQAIVVDQPCAVFAKWAPRVARFSFQSGRVLFKAR